MTEYVFINRVAHCVHCGKLVERDGKFCSHGHRIAHAKRRAKTLQDADEKLAAFERVVGDDSYA